MPFAEGGDSNFASKLIIPGLNPNDDEKASLFQSEPIRRDNVPWKLVTPNAGFCVKSKTFEGDKIFINIGHTDGIPPPDDISNEELLKILESDDKSGFKIPMSIGDAHVETDKSDNLCTVYDVVINSTFYEKVKNNDLFKGFFIYITLQAVMEKYGIELDMSPSPGYVILKNRKCMGPLRDHRIEQRAPKKHSKPLIEEISSHESTPRTEVDFSCTKWDQGNLYDLYQFPKEGSPLFFLTCISLPVKSVSSDVNLSVGEDRILLKDNRNGHIIMDSFFPSLVDPKSIRAVFNEDQKVLIIRVDVAKECVTEPLLKML